MYLELVEHFQSQDTLPIEAEDIAAKLVELGCQDSIRFCPEDIDPGELKGAIYQYTVRPGVYSPPEFVTLIVYSQNLPTDWQRVVCAKELVHVCEGSVGRTDTPEEVEGLLEKILGPLSNEDFGLSDLMASIDKLAIYQAIDLLFPLAARHDARRALDEGTADFHDIVDWVQIPAVFVKMVLADEWLEFRAILHDIDHVSD